MIDRTRRATLTKLRRVAEACLIFAAKDQVNVDKAPGPKARTVCKKPLSRVAIQLCAELSGRTTADRAGECRGRLSPAGVLR